MCAFVFETVRLFHDDKQRWNPASLGHSTVIVGRIEPAERSELLHPYVRPTACLISSFKELFIEKQGEKIGKIFKKKNNYFVFLQTLRVTKNGVKAKELGVEPRCVF